MWQLKNVSSFELTAIWVVLGVAVLELIYAVFLRRQVLRFERGAPRMQEVRDAIRVGEDAYLRKQLRTIVPTVAVIAVLLFFSVYLISSSSHAMGRFQGLAAGRIQFIVGLRRAIAFVMGSAFSVLVGQLGRHSPCWRGVTTVGVARYFYVDSASFKPMYSKNQTYVAAIAKRSSRRAAGKHRFRCGEELLADSCIEHNGRAAPRRGSVSCSPGAARNGRDGFIPNQLRNWKRD